MSVFTFAISGIVVVASVNLVTVNHFFVCWHRRTDWRTDRQTDWQTDRHGESNTRFRYGDW